MNIGDFKEVGKNILEKGEMSNLITNFIKEISNNLEKNNKKPNNSEEIENFKSKVEEIRNKIKEKNNSQVLEEGKIYVINDINDEKIGVVDIEDGHEFNIYLSTDSESLNKLNERGINTKIYEMKKEEFDKLELGNNIHMKNGKCMFYEGEIEIKNADAYDTLQNLYFNLEQEEKRNNE